jgi:hypothetical protein
MIELVRRWMLSIISRKFCDLCFFGRKFLQDALLALNLTSFASKAKIEFPREFTHAADEDSDQVSLD